ncbi:MAG: TRAP transporter substrate-binding protein DctP [Pseudomonadota bacterium]
MQATKGAERPRIRIGGYQGGQSVHTKGVEAFRSSLQSALDDCVELVVTPNVTTSGRRAADLLEMVAGDELDICYFSASYLADRVPSIGLLDLPFEIADRDQAYAILDGAVGRHLANELQQATPYRLLGYWDNGFRNLSNRSHPIAAPGDCRGLSLRTLDNAFHQEVFRSLGFEPRVIDVRDLVPAVADGSIDAQENPLTNIVHFDIAAHHPYVTISRHFFGVAALLCNKQRFAAWPSAVREAVEAAATQATAMQRRLAKQEDIDCLTALNERGNQVLTLTEDQRDQFRQAVRPVVERQSTTFPDALLADVRGR